MLGIDLGTTNSAFAVMEGDEAEMIANRDGNRTTPSVIGVTEDGERLVGKQAKNQAVQNPNNTVESIKRHMGEDDYTVTLRGEKYTPEEVSAMILQRIKRDAEEKLGQEINRAVITVPAYFNDKQRQATKDAGKIAGFEVERILNEPTAAAMAFDIRGTGSLRVLVFDLGGGTFDVTILTINDGVYDVLSTSGDRSLGGDDWDQKIIDWVVEDFEDEHGIDLRNDSQAMQRISDAAEEAKIELSTREKTTISLPFITASDKTGPIHIDKTLTRDKFEELSKDLVERTKGPTKKALDQADMTMEDLDELVLVGGATRMPMIQKQMSNASKTANPDEVVSLGAAIQGGIISGSVDDTVLLDVTPLSIGVEVKGGLFKPLIDKNTTIPTQESNIFTTAEDNQTSVQIRVFQGERELAKHNELLGEFTMTGIPAASAGVPHIKVNFSIDEDGIVHVEAEDKGTGKTEGITIEGGSGLSEEEIKEMKREAKRNADEDQKERERIQERNRAEALIPKAREFMDEFEDKLTATDVKKIESKIENVEDLLDSNKPDLVELQEANNELDTVLSNTGDSIMDTNGKPGLGIGDM